MNIQHPTQRLNHQYKKDYNKTKNSDSTFSSTSHIIKIKYLFN